MEISKGLQQEIQLVQNKLKNAIRDHQICVGKLKDDPNNADILGRIQEIQLHIVALGRCQKQVVQRLRKEVEAFKSENASEVKVSVASLLGLNNNNHITANNEATADEISEVKVVVTNGLDNARLAAAKEDYEEIVRNGDVARPPRVNVRKKERSLSVETLSAEEEITEVVEVDENSDDKRRVSREPESPPPPPPEQRKPNCKAQLNFLETLGLITTSKFTELQNKRAERKRRSTANPQFVYSNWEIPTKRKRHNYLQSAANVPQTRQTTARLNGPSPPPTANKAASAVPPPKSTSPPTRTIAKSLIPTQKATTRPNILRNMAESRVFVNKGRMENGNGQVQLPSGAKTVAQTTGNSKTVHIPGLPLGLTIERIENDSAVCINCRNPGTLTNCDNCEANYHVSCHTISPPPPRLCPKCALRLKDSNAGVGPATTTTTTPPPSTTTKKNEELVAAPHAPGVAGQAGEDPEVDKAPGGFHKAGAAAKQQQQPHQQQHQIAGRGVNQLPASTFLIPISSNALAAAGGAFGHPDASSSSLNLLKSPGDTTVVTSSPAEVPFSTSLVIGHQLSRSSVTYVPQSSQPQHQHQRLSYAYQLPLGAASSDAPKSYFIVKKIADPGKPIDGSSAGNSQSSSSASSSSSSRGRSARGDETSGGGGGGRAASHLDKLTGRLAESIARGWKKKSATRAIPGLNRIAPGKSLPATAATTAAVATDNADRDDMDKSPGVAHNGGGSTSRQSGGNQQQQQQQNQRIAGRRGSAATTFVKRRGLENAAGKTGEQRQLVVRKKSRGKFARAAVDSVLAVDNAADKLADRGDDEKRGEGTAAAAVGGSDETRESDSRATGEDRSGGCDVAAAAEHVKLEEAHLSAPPGAKLMRDEEQKQQKKKPGGLGEDRRPIGRLRNAARIMSSRRRTTEDRARTPDLTRASDASRQERNRPRILMRPERKSLESGESLLGDSAANGRRFDPDFAAFGPRGLRKAVGSETDSADEDSSHEFGGADREEVGTTMRKFVDRKDEEIERKDLSEELEAEGNDEEDEEEEIDEEDDEEDEEDEEIVEEEEEEEDQEDCPILDEDMNDAANERRLGINAVSPESLQVLEQFESAMLQSASGDLTAKP